MYVQEEELLVHHLRTMKVSAKSTFKIPHWLTSRDHQSLLGLSSGDHACLNKSSSQSVEQRQNKFKMATPSLLCKNLFLFNFLIYKCLYTFCAKERLIRLDQLGTMNNREKKSVEKNVFVTHLT